MGEAEIDALLQANPRDIAALVAKGDARTAAGDDRGGNAFYTAALRQAAASQPLPGPLRPVLERAQAGLARAARLFAEHLERSLAAASFPPGRRPLRFQESLDILLGRRDAQMGIQRPTSYFYPGLPQRRYYERSELPWSAAIEAAAPFIREELAAWIARGDDDRFSAYVVSDPSRPPRDVHGLVDNPAWSTLYLWEKGAPVAALAEHFPKTLAAIAALDIPHIGSRAPSILFSRLAPGARIPPHHGMINARLICHLPLIVPRGCGFRVGGEMRRWAEGELLVFDDTVEHEAWNDGDCDRYLLIFDVWRPELDSAERRAVTALFDAIDSYPS